MNKSIVKYFMFTLISFMFITSFALADDSCSYKDQQALMKEAQNIKVNYEIVDELNKVNDLPEDTAYRYGDYYYFKVNILNLTENFYVEISNDQDDNKMTYSFSDAVEGIVSFKNDYSNATTYKINIFSNNGNCFNKQLISKKIIVPKFNIYYGSEQCKDIPEYKYCQQYIEENLSDVKLSAAIAKYARSKESNEIAEKEEKSNIFSYIKYIGCAALGIGLIVLLIILIQKRQMKRRGL